MGRIHQWYYLKDKEGRPIENASVNLYLTGTKTEATIYESATTSASFDQSTWLTAASGFFSFYLGDQFESTYIGYDPDQNFDIVWAASGSIYYGDDAPSGIIDNLQMQPKIYSVNENSRNNIVKNKMVSDELAYKWDRHPNKTYASEPHGIEPVDINDSTDVTFNKVVNDDVIKRLVSFPIVSAGEIVIATSGALIAHHTLYSSAYTPSGDYLKAEFDTKLSGRNRPFPIVQIYDIASGDQITPVKIHDLDDTTMRVVMVCGAGGKGADVLVTILGETKVKITTI